ncbi:putative RNA-directed DNA polymerase from transposon X-element [Folsomia candida]|uniref:Putative RNA-directed DNA polymerase from transposon X-element n=1 Tax=Folsomia candida TaxID=158441 RepID=A0A226DD09_FOLCA|nr:putative RNA-directed DNA polymerase from transposon X-element [Folsomia candida]
MHDHIQQEFIEHLEEIHRNYSADSLIVGGDFNARVGELCHESDELMVSNRIKGQRHSEDKIISRRGRELLLDMTASSMPLLNGRAKGDEITFIGGQGSSTIDLVFVNPKAADLTQHMSVNNLPYSSHLPCKLSLNANLTNQAILLRRVRWDNNKKEKYVEAINSLTKLQTDSEMSYSAISDTILEAANAAGMIKTSCYGKIQSKPWFDTDCKESRKDLNSILHQAKKHGWNYEISNNYREQRAKFKYLCRAKKKDYDDAWRMKLGSCKGSSEFWRAVKRLRHTVPTPNLIQEKDWISFHKNLMPSREFDTNEYLGNMVEELDCDIGRDELVRAMNKLKNNKSPGPDCIVNELLKNLPDSGVDMVLNLLNRIMKKEEVPLEWTESVTCMIFKEGDESNPANYRPISLLNTMLKLFTQVLYGRLVIWAEKNKLIPECQGGFRSGRSCEDQILCLQTAIHAKLKQEKGNALFVDFERCFNTLPHNKMWNKLFSLGMSGKIIRILKSLYENASTRVRMEHGLTQPIDITEGVMQGEIVSPFLYSLYVSEMEKLLINSNIPGVKIERDFFLHLLCYADDTVVLASTPINLQHKINILKEYFEELGLKVNLSKTKIMVLGKEVRSGEYGPLNWVGQVNKLLEEMGYGNFMHSLDASLIPAMLERVIDISRQEDISKVNCSTRYSHYKELINLTPGPAPYLEFNLPFKKLTLIAQARLNLTSFYHEKYVHKLNVDEICNICNCKEEESIFHVLWNCRVYGGSRMWIRELEGKKDKTMGLLCNKIGHADSIYKYLNEVLRMRILMLEEDNLSINRTNTTNANIK